MAQTYKQILGDIKKKNLSPCYLFYGVEDFLINEAVQTILKHAVEAGSEDFNLDILYGNEVDGAQIVNAASAFPMMAERRVVVVKNIDNLKTASLDLLLKYVNKPSPTTVLAMTATKISGGAKSSLGQIKANSVSGECKPLYDNQVPDWIRGYLQESKMTINEEAVHLLQSSVGNGLQALSSELEKIKINLDDGEQITVQHIENIVGVSKQYNIFELCDSIGKKDITASIHILGHMLQLGESPTAILAMLVRHFTILLKIQNYKARRFAPKDIAAKVQRSPYFINNYMAQAQKYSHTQLKNSFTYFLEADKNLKTSFQKPKLVLETLIFKLNYL